MVIVIMGVSGSGKTTIGRALAESLRWGFSDADDFHSAANVEKMKNGIPLTDEDREPWLRSIRAAIEQWNRDEPGHVLACSALKGSYREILGQEDPEVKFVYLQGGFDLISQRLCEHRAGAVSGAVEHSGGIEDARRLSRTGRTFREQRPGSVYYEHAGGSTVRPLLWVYDCGSHVGEMIGEAIVRRPIWADMSG
jgi:gluconokinase